MTFEEWKMEMVSSGSVIDQIDFADFKETGLFMGTKMKYGQQSKVYFVWWKGTLIQETILLHAAFEIWNQYKKPKEDGTMAEKKKEETPWDIYKGYLMKTKREGIEDLLQYLEDIGFKEVPASGGNHSNQVGGLLQHSLNVLQVAEKISVALIGGKNMTDEIRNAVVISSLLHDIGKCGDFDKKMYVENILKSGKQSEAKPWKRNPELSAVPHAVRSVKLATLFIDLTEDEEWAILTHDGMYDYARTFLQGHESQLFMILHWSDLWASRVMEGGNKDEAEND